MQGIRNTIAHNFRLVFLVLFFFNSVGAGYELQAQQNFYDTDLLPSSFHEGRRDALRNILPPNSCAVLFSNPIRNRSNDVDFYYTQDPDLFYLTGLQEPHSVLMVFKDKIQIGNSLTNEILFVQDRDSSYEVWNGPRLGINGAIERLGFTTVYLNKEFKDITPDLSQFESILVKFPTDIKESKGTRPTLNSLVYQLRDKIEKAGKEANVPALLKCMATLREIKLPEEIMLLQKAVDITNEGLAEVMRAMEPGMTEYQAQAIVEFYFKFRGAENPGYNSISGGGENTSVLHYVTNRKKLSSGDLLLMDVGAEYRGYTADITRTFPVNGSFTTEQKLIYDLVLEAQVAGIKEAVAGNSFYDPHKATSEIIANGLIKLGIIKNKSDSKKLFNHGSSHYLGLEVHDPGSYGELKPGMVITVEPGIYIPEGTNCDKKWWNIGIRIEDNVLVTDNEPVVMSKKLPKTTTEIETLMKEPSLLNQLK